MSPTRLDQVRQLQEQIAQIQAHCEHRFVNDDSRLPAKQTPVVGLYFDQTELLFTRRCEHCDLKQTVSDKECCPLCVSPMSPKYRFCSMLEEYTCWPLSSYNDDWHFRHLYKGRFCSNPDCPYGRVWCTERRWSHG